MKINVTHVPHYRDSVSHSFYSWKIELFHFSKSEQRQDFEGCNAELKWFVNQTFLKQYIHWYFPVFFFFQQKQVQYNQYKWNERSAPPCPRQKIHFQPLRWFVKLATDRFSASACHHEVKADCTIQCIQNNETIRVYIYSLETLPSLHSFVCHWAHSHQEERKVDRQSIL